MSDITSITHSYVSVAAENPFELQRAPSDHKIHRVAKTFFAQSTKMIKEGLQNAHRFFSTIYALPNIINTVLLYLSQITFFVPLVMGVQFIAQIFKFIANIVSIQLLALSVIGIITNTLQIPFTSWDLYKSNRLRVLTNTVLYIENFDLEKADKVSLKKLLKHLEKAQRLLEARKIKMETDDRYPETEKMIDWKDKLSRILDSATHDFDSLKNTLTSLLDEQALPPENLKTQLDDIKKALMDATLEIVIRSYLEAEPDVPETTIEEVEIAKLQKLKNIVGDKCAEYVKSVVKTKITYERSNAEIQTRGPLGLDHYMNKDSLSEEEKSSYLIEGKKVITHLNQKSVEHVIIHTIAITALALALIGAIGILFFAAPPLPIILMIAFASGLQITNFIIKRGFTTHEGHYFSYLHFIPNWLTKLIVKTALKKEDPTVFCKDVHERTKKTLTLL